MAKSQEVTKSQYPPFEVALSPDLPERWRRLYPQAKFGLEGVRAAGILTAVQGAQGIFRLRTAMWMLQIDLAGVDPVERSTVEGDGLSALRGKLKEKQRALRVLDQRIQELRALLDDTEESTGRDGARLVGIDYCTFDPQKDEVTDLTTMSWGPHQVELKASGWTATVPPNAKGVQTACADAGGVLFLHNLRELSVGAEGRELWTTDGKWKLTPGREEGVQRANQNWRKGEIDRDALDPKVRGWVAALRHGPTVVRLALQPAAISPSFLQEVFGITPSAPSAV